MALPRPGELQRPAQTSRGRPRADEPGTALTTWVPSSEYDRLVKLANERGESLSRLVRDWLAKHR